MKHFALSFLRIVTFSGKLLKILCQRRKYLFEIKTGWHLVDEYGAYSLCSYCA